MSNEANSNTPAAAPELGSPQWWVSQMAEAGAPAAEIEKYRAQHNITATPPAGTTTPAPTTPAEPVHGASPAPAAPGRIGGPGSEPAHWLQQMEKAGASPDAIAQAARELGLSDEQLAQLQAGPDGMDAYLASIGAAPPASASEYVLPTVPGADDPAAVIEGTKLAQAWLHEAKLPKPIGEAVARFALEWEQGWSKLDEGSRALEMQKTNAILARMWGANTQANLLMVREHVAAIEAKSPGLVEYLETSGVGNDPRVVTQLFLNAARQFDGPSAK